MDTIKFVKIDLSFVTCQNMSMKSLWVEKEDYFNRNSEFKSHYDFIIIGAGIAGLSCAYWIEKYAPNAKVLVIDKGYLGVGASGRNAGFLTGGSIGYFNYLFETYGEEEALKKWKFTTDNVGLLKSELDLSECDYRENGTVSLYSKDEDISELIKRVELLKENNFLVEHSSNVFDMQGIDIKTDATFNPILVLKKIKSLLKNCDFLFNEEVSEVSRNLVRSSRKSFQCNKVILATNYELPKFLPALKIEPQRSQICYIKCDCSNMGGANYFIPKKRIYFRRYEDGLIIGGLRVIDLDNENTETLALNEKIQKALLAQCEELFGASNLVYAWAGIMGFTKDEQPLLGESDGVYYLGGFSGHGNGYAFTMARDLINQYIIR